MRKFNIFLLTTFIFCLFSGSLRAQTGSFYSTDNVLSNSLINNIYQDSRNFIWIATEDGLNRYDGVRFNVYRNRRNDTGTLKNNYVRTVFEDSKGRFWVGCINGLMRYDRGTDSFTEIPIYFRNQIVEPHITSVIETPEGEILVSTSGGGIIRPNKDFSAFTVDENLFPHLCSRYLVKIFRDSEGFLWVASENQGLNRINMQNMQIETFRAPLSIGSNQISDIEEDTEGNIFVGTLTGGLFRFDKTTQKFLSVPYRNPEVVLPVKSLLFDKQRGLLVGTDGRGIMYLNRNSGKLDDYRIQNAQFDFSKTKIHALFTDKNHNLWTGLFQKGVFLAPNHPNKFRYWGAKSFYQNVIGASCVMSVLRDENQMLWVGTDNDGLYAIDPQGKSSHYELKASPNGVSGTVMGILNDGSASLWLASYLDGLVQFDKRSGRSKNFREQLSGFQYHTSAGRAMTLAAGTKNDIWVGTNGAGVLVFDKSLQKYVKQYLFHEEDSSGIANNWVNILRNDGDTLMWVGTYGGVSSIDLRNDKITTYRIKGGVLPGNIVYAVARDKQGKMWFGTTEGLAAFDMKKNVSKHYTIDDGLPGNVICGILEDERSNLWISTHTGIAQFVKTENRFLNYYAYDGLQGNEFSMGAAFKAADGELVFGGVGGVSAFYPAQIVNRRAPIEVQLTGLYVFDKPVVQGQKSGRFVITDKFIIDTEKIRLSHKDNMFSFEFSTFDFGAPGRVFYRYRMEGLNDQWITTEQGTNRISFTNLGYGHYKLRIKAVVDNSESDEKVLNIIIYPPWYLSWFAKLIYFLLFVALVWGVYRFITERLQHKQEMLRREHIEQVNEGKLQFFINISHEIRTPMTLIISPLEKLLTEHPDPAKLQVYQLMYRNAQRILRLINQMLDIRKIDKGLMFVKMRETDMVGFIDDLMTTFDYQAKKRNISFGFLHEMNHLPVWLDLNNFDKVLVNILSNAFKFTPENGGIVIKLTTGADHEVTGPLSRYCEITVSDTGSGIQEDKIEKIFERFYQVDHTQMNVNFGTGIGLHLARTLVELMHGKIFARNRHDSEGSEFIIRLPLGSEHIPAAERETQIEALPHKITEIIQLDEQDEMTPQYNVRPRTKYRVLIVEDESDIRHYLSSELSDTYRISECVNGKEALEFILKEKPDLVISDVMMPEMDGITLCKKLKSNVNINHIPIILLTARSSDEDKAEGFDIGADAYVAKPFNLELLRKRVANILENRERLELKRGDQTNPNIPLIKQVVLKSSDQILLEKITRIINQNIDNPDLNVEMLAEGVGMSRVHMHRKLKELTNQSARDFIRTIRLRQAAELLSNQKLTVSEVAYALGFSNLSHFSNTFREFYGVSPKEFGENGRKANNS